MTNSCINNFEKLWDDFWKLWIKNDLNWDRSICLKNFSWRVWTNNSAIKNAVNWVLCIYWLIECSWDFSATLGVVAVDALIIAQNQLAGPASNSNDFIAFDIDLTVFDSVFSLVGASATVLFKRQGAMKCISIAKQPEQN